MSYKNYHDGHSKDYPYKCIRDGCDRHFRWPGDCTGCECLKQACTRCHTHIPGVEPQATCHQRLCDKCNALDGGVGALEDAFKATGIFWLTGYSGGCFTVSLRAPKTTPPEDQLYGEVNKMISPDCEDPIWFTRKPNVEDDGSGYGGFILEDDFEFHIVKPGKHLAPCEITPYDLRKVILWCIEHDIKSLDSWRDHTAKRVNKDGVLNIDFYTWHEAHKPE
jgi:hypothetical protein